MNTIAITGATGQLGRIVVRQLRDRVGAEHLVGLARSPDKARDLSVPVRQADYDRPETLPEALAGVDTLLLISGSEVGKRAAQHHAVLEAARAAGVGRVVYTSLLHADASPIDLAAEHRATEADLKASGLPYTILRNGWYTENYLGSIDAALAHGAVLGSAGDGRIASATRADFAAAAVAVVTGEGHVGKTYELAGTPWTLTDLAAELSRQTGKEIVYRNLPADAYAQVLVGAGVPEGFAHMIAGWDVAAAEGALFDDGGQLAALIGRSTTPLADAVSAALAARG